MKKLHALIAAAALALASCSSGPQQEANFRVVPLPHQIELATDAKPFVLNASTKIAVANDSLLGEAEFLRGFVADLTGRDLKITDDTNADNTIVLAANLDAANPEAYQITVTDKQIAIDGATSAGTFYGVQTLRKAIPAKVVPSSVAFPAGTVTDQPRFAYRGTLLDVARHPMEPDSVKAFIDMIAMHNINRLHWHLTDDQGWRIEIKKYPKLVELGSTRPGTMFERNWDQFDTIPVSGYYTQEEARDIVKYAADRHITIIPEIDLPGHMVAALKAYPELGCTGGPYEVWQKWGVSEDLLCAGNDSTYAFIDGVLTEIADIFPSEFIHIGGDECPKVRWHECPKCQAKIKALGLKGDKNASAEARLQSYVMQHAQDTLGRLGRRIIGWDEILEGGITGDAVVMSWRGTDAAHEAAQLGHDAILTPTAYCYFDYSQSLDQSTEPVGIGGFVSVEKVYNFEPINEKYSPEEAAHILGVQANLWREYIKTLSHSQYMELPRLAALSEVQWVEAGNKDYPDFLNRLQQLINLYEAQGYNYARHIYDVTAQAEPDRDGQAVVVTLSTAIDEPIHYTLDGSEPTADSPLYAEPLRLSESGTVKAVAIDPHGHNSHVATTQAKISKATFKPVALASTPNPRWSTNPETLTDGIVGGDVFDDPAWMGFDGCDFVATVDLGAPEEISSVTIGVLVDSSNWLYDARSFKVEVSDDGKTFKTVASEDFPAMTKHVRAVTEHTLDFAPVAAQYVRVTAANEKAMPDWRGTGAGKPALIFIDEISID